MLLLLSEKQNGCVCLQKFNDRIITINVYDTGGRDLKTSAHISTRTTIKDMFVDFIIFLLINNISIDLCCYKLSNTSYSLLLSRNLSLSLFPSVLLVTSMD